MHLLPITWSGWPICGCWGARRTGKDVLGSRIRTCWIGLTRTRGPVSIWSGSRRSFISSRWAERCRCSWLGTRWRISSFRLLGRTKVCLFVYFSGVEVERFSQNRRSKTAQHIGPEPEHKIPINSPHSMLAWRYRLHLHLETLKKRVDLDIGKLPRADEPPVHIPSRNSPIRSMALLQSER